ncbi:MAG: thioredoxin domain-containing protein [Acidobacteriota bacterium]
MLPPDRPRLVMILALLAASVAIEPACRAGERSAETVEAAPASIATPPGAEPYAADLKERLAAALLDKGPDYRPRTHHLRPDGRPIFTNRLILETSPYLLQHAHNPVDWYPWGEEAFSRARELDRPILLSVGYSTCHWCHVMERESFEDLEIARFLNERFVAIKVDREERPDVDGVYMSAVQMLTGRGGWPMTIVMTPDRRPFFGGTYFPARSGDRGARKGFWEILHELDEAYRSDREAVVSSAAQISRRVAQALAGRRPEGVPDAGPIARAAELLARTYDPVHGGFGRGRKFPRPVTLRLLLRYHRRTGDRAALAMVERTLERMAAGGIHDQVGGGFHRYTVEPTWLIPHFEKMLYDNAQLAVVYLEAHQATGRADFAAVARRTLDYLAREMSDEDGGFYSATDADSPSPSGHDEEGLFFTWTPEEIRDAVGAELAPVVTAYYGASERGNFEGRSVLSVPSPAPRIAAHLGMPVERLLRKIDEARASLYRARARRRPPHADTKILTAWNGLAVSAFARGAQVLGEQRYRDRAARAATFLLARCREGGRLRRSFAAGRPGPAGVLSDYAFLAAGLLDLYETTFDPRWLEEAIALHRTLEERFWDASAGGYFMTPDDGERLLAREKPDYDGAEPSGNSVALMNLLRLHEFTGHSRYRAMAERGFSAFAATLGGSPSALPLMLCALDYYLDRPKEVVLVAAREPGEAGPFLEVLAHRFLPNRVLVVAAEGEGLARAARVTTLLENRVARDGRPTAYVCEGRVCKFPTTDPQVFARQIAEVSPYEGVRLAPLRPPDPPEPWEYDRKADRHWHPGHGHWHDGPPPPEDRRK